MDSKHSIRNNLKMLSMKDKTKVKKKILSDFPKRSSSLQTARTLQANNRSLALSLEKMRHEFLQAHTYLTKLKKRNIRLKEQVVELKRRQSDKVVEKEVNKRCKERFGIVKNKIFVLNDLATEFVDTLTDLSEICFSAHFSEAVSLSPPHSGPINRRTDGALFAFDQTDGGCDYEGEDDILKHCASLRKSQILGKSFNKEQSSLSSSNENISALSGAPTDTSNSGSTASGHSKKPNSQSKLSLSRQSRRRKKLSHKSVKNVGSKIYPTKSIDSPQKSSVPENGMRRSGGFTSSNVISDISIPQCEVGDHHDVAKGKDFQSPNKLSSHLELLSASAEKKQKKPNDSPSKSVPMVWSSSSLEELSVLTFEMPSELCQPQKTNNRISSHKKRSSPSRKPQNQKKNSNNFSSADMNKAGNFSISDTVLEHENKDENYVNNTNKHVLPVYENRKQNLLPKDGIYYLTNEETEANDQGKLSDITLSVSNTSNRDKIKADVLQTCIARKGKQEHNTYKTRSERFLDKPQPISNSDQLLNEIKTMIEPTEDCNYSPGSCGKTRLKPKNGKTGKRNNLIHRNSQPGLDVKDKSHKLSSSKRQKVKLVSELSTDQFSSSPPMYLKSNRSRSRNKRRGAKQFSSAEVGHTNNSSSKRTAHLLISEDSIPRQELLDNCTVTDLYDKTKSYSHYEEQNQCKSNKRGVRRHGLSGLKQIQSKLSSAGTKMKDLLKPVDVSLYLAESAPEIMTQCKKLVGSEEVQNEDTSNIKIMTDGIANSQNEFEISNASNVKPETNSNLFLISGEDKTFSPNILGCTTEPEILSNRKKEEEDMICLSFSCSDINAEICDILPSSILAYEADTLEGDTSESLMSVNSSVENFKTRK